MLNIVDGLPTLLRHPIFLVIISLVFLLTLAGFFLRLLQHRLVRRRFWSTVKDSRTGMNESEALKHIRRISLRDISSRKGKSKIIQGVHWSTYISLLNLRYRISKVPADIIAMIPASVWLFDNYYLLYRALKRFQESGGESRFRHLPVIVGGPARGYPRVYVLAREMVACCGYHLGEEQIYRLLNEYQKESVLTIAELWAFQNVLSLCLLEEIIIESGRIVRTITTKKDAESRLRKVMPAFSHKQGQLADALRGFATSEQLADPAFLAHIILRLRSLSIEDSAIEDWLQSCEWPHEETSTARLASTIYQEGQFEAESETTISGLIGSLKCVTDLNWEEMFPRISSVDRILADDPAVLYGGMTAETKAQYRKVIERLAAAYHLSESYIAGEVIQIARKETDPGDRHSRLHIGYFLLGEGLYRLLDDLDGSGRYKRLIDRLSRKMRSLLYFVGIAIVTLGLLLAAEALVFIPAGIDRLIELVLLLILVFPASDVAILLMNSLFTRLFKPVPMPALDYTGEIPVENRTFVVMPVIVERSGQIQQWASRLEKHYLANRQKNLFFALLADYHDAPAKEIPEDRDILDQAIAAIRELNQRYPDDPTRFFLFFRRREWNPSQNCWMGWERKRGKLEAFNALLLDESQDGIDMVIGDRAVFPTIRYVITLDSDTELLRDGAAQLIGIMAHPLCQPVLDQRRRKIIRGYAIVQSQIRTRVSSRTSTLFSRFFSGQDGIDPYATLASDIYQDLFDEGIYIGKGIYDLRVFHEFLRGSIRENTILSHDLLEGSLSRCAFASGIKMMDSCPASVIVYTSREHRWIRGDWQLLPWLFASAGINGLSRWKIADNLRRSLVRPAQLLLIIANAVLLPGNFWLWAFFAFFDPLLRIITFLLTVGWRKIRNPSARLAKMIIFEQLGTIIAQTLISMALLPYRAFLALDAICRTLYRLLISHKNMLEWQTMDSVEMEHRDSPAVYWRRMWPSVLPAIALAACMIKFPGMLQVLAWLSLAALWLTSPWIASRSSILLRYRRQQHLDPAKINRLRLTARRTWRYFEDHSTINNNWLCPDNFQQYPGSRTSSKTSPTNIGLQLLAALSARDLGYIGLYQLIDFCANIFDTLRSLPKWHGHLYNWYNIKTLQVLYPRYVSTVDSGNFCAHIIALKQGLLQLRQLPVITGACLRGLADTCALAGIPADRLPENLSTIDEWTSLLTSLQDEKNSSQNLDEEWFQKLSDMIQAFQTDLEKLGPAGDFAAQASLQAMASTGHEEAASLIRSIDSIAAEIDKLVAGADFSYLYDRNYHLLLIGFNVASQQADSSHYDLLASEARVTSFIAIAKGDISQRHWFTLARPLTLIKGIPACVSWSGSMFEYLMPGLIMQTPAGTILEQSCLAAVLQQIRYARRQKIPWGISESQHFRFDADSNYQYGPFGVPRIRLQATLKPARVVAPYATVLALQTLPNKALDNLDELRSLGVEGKYGFYEALDFNQPNVTNFQPYSLIQSFMTHHQGMSLVAMNNFLNRDIMRRRFHTEPMVQATEVLLEEKRSSGIITLASRGYTISLGGSTIADQISESRICSQYGRSRPLVHILSNNHYNLMITSDGAGFSSFDDIRINRWNSDLLRGQNGTFIYIHNLTDNLNWSAAYLPTRTPPDEYQAVFSHDKIEFIRRDGVIQTHTRLTISPLKNFEVRQVTLTNYSSRPAMIELTSYLEPVIDDALADDLHPAFSKLFIETEYIAERNLLIANRRLRNPGDHPRYVLHTVVPGEKTIRPVEFEVDRKHFIGRGGSLANPEMLSSSSPMTNQAGFTRDTILSLRVTVAIEPGKSATVSFITGYCQSRSEVLELSHELGKPYHVADVFRLALTSSLLELRYLNITTRQVFAILNLTSFLFYPDQGACGESCEALGRLSLGQSGFWRFGISGDHPIILLRVTQLGELAAVQDVLLAYEYLWLNQVKPDLVILNEEPAGYSQTLEHRLREITGSLPIFSTDTQKTRLFMLRRSYMSQEEFDLLLACACLVLNGKTGLYSPLADWEPAIERPERAKGTPLPAGRQLQPEMKESDIYAPDQLEFFNGIGGFGRNGQEYEIHLVNGVRTPMPWINVIANDTCGFLVSETGAGYTWCGNSRENKLTCWSNDPVLDPVSEAVYIHDPVNGGITSPASLVPCQSGSYRVRHGFGYTVFHHRELQLDQEMTLFVPANEPIKLYWLKLTNLSDEPRELTLSFFVEWVLGVLRSQTARTICTAYDVEHEILTACNNYDDARRGQPAFVFCSSPLASHSGDRRNLFQDGDSVRYPSGLLLDHMPDKTGEGLDPCAIIQTTIRLEPQETKEVVFGLGQARTPAAAASLATRYRRLTTVKSAFGRMRKRWLKKLGVIAIHTPDRSMDLLVNGWLLYQVIACRLRARSAFDQCGGAIGFRDQLQDVLALLEVDPGQAQRQILLCCAHQFKEGDVMHWWHADTDLGVRTRIADDMLWLPFVVASYIRSTGELALLDNKVPFLDGPLLPDDRMEMMIQPHSVKPAESVYQHCLRAIDRASGTGEHGLPLMGGGDWNDGMNRVGYRGQGESVWLGWFLYDVLQRFIPIASEKGDPLVVQRFKDQAAELLSHIERHAWDGEWYMRAFFDDGTPLGSKICDECRIDSISQSWSVLSQGAGRIHALTALDSARRQLVRDEDGLSLLLSPPFNKTDHDPGYIKGYNPGIRENGGQYTHAAIWLAMAFARAGNGEMASQLLAMLNPVRATATLPAVSKYEKEPYVMAADVSMGGVYTGKAGWSWYTGSAGWMYQTLLHAFLGICKENDELVIDPQVPVSFKRYVVEYRFGTALYEMTILLDQATKGATPRLRVDNREVEGNRIRLVDDGTVHNVEFRFFSS